MDLVREKWSKQKSRRLLFRELWPWAAEYNGCSVQAASLPCNCCIPLVFISSGHWGAWSGPVGSIAKHHLVSERSLKLIKCRSFQSALRNTIFYLNFMDFWLTHCINFIGKSSFNVDPKFFFILSCTFCLYYSGVKCHLCSLLWYHLTSGKVEISPDWQSSAHTMQQLRRRLGWD